MSSILDNFWFVSLAGMAFLLMPFWAAALIAWRSKYSIQRRRAFVFICAVFSFGLVSLFGFTAPIAQLVNMFVGANSSGWLASVSYALWEYGAYFILFVFALVSTYVPLRVARSWAGLVAAWR